MRLWLVFRAGSKWSGLRLSSFRVFHQPQPQQAQKVESGAEMTDEIELAHGSGNVFRDLGLPNPEIEQMKAILAAIFIGVLDGHGISVRRAHEMTGFAAADFSRVRQGKLSRFTIDRLMAMLDRLDQDVEVTVSVQPRRQAAPIAPQAA
jgi:predicted XRE-type DNA-binding protein